MWRNWASDSVHPLKTLFDAAARGYSIKLTCRGCARSEILSAHAVWHHARRKGISQRLADLAGRCRCDRCGRRQPLLDLVHDPPTKHNLPMPSLHEWKAELRRHR